MRVALVTHFFAHYRRTVFELLLAHPRHRLTLVGDPDSSAHDGTIATWLPPDRSRMVATSFVRLPGGLLWQRGVVRLALSRRYDGLIFVADMKWLSSWVAAFVARALGKQVYYWAHGWRQRDHGLKGAVRRCYFSLANRLLLYGRRSRGIAIENGFDPRRVHVIYNCLDYPAQRAARARLGPVERRALRVSLFGDAEAPVVACPTRLVPQRRLDLLLEAVARLRAEHGRRVHVLLVGDGPERPALEALAARLGLAVHFAGACYDEERMAGYLTAATCTVAPGMVGLTAMHSLAFGVPVLTHGDPDRQMPEAEAVVPGVTGDHFRNGDVADLAAAIERWTRTTFPAPAVSAACIRVIERFYNPDSQLALIVEALDGLPARAISSDRIQADELGEEAG
jgi:glycosyltransferase involved in cell wall biosynthesis